MDELTPLRNAIGECQSGDQLEMVYSAILASAIQGLAHRLAHMSWDEVAQEVMLFDTDAALLLQECAARYYQFANQYQQPDDNAS